MRSLKLQGSPLQRGRQHGEELRKEIHEISQIRKHLIRTFMKKWSAWDLEKLAYDQLIPLQSYPDLWNEFIGISEGSHLSLTDLVILNNYTDMRDFSADDDGKNTSHLDTGGCSLFGYATKETTFSAQTWDMHASALPYVVHLEVDEPKNKTQILTVAGCLGLAGVNQHGLSVMINNLQCGETKLGLVWPFYVRLVLQKSSVQKVLEELKDAHPSSGHNYLFSDPSEIYDVETTGIRHQVYENYSVKKPGLTFHTNHYLTSLQEIEIKNRVSKTTHKRYDEMKEYFSKDPWKNQSGTQIAEDVFSGKKLPSICIPKPNDPHAPMTCGGIIVDHFEKKATFFQGTYDQKDLLEFSL